MKLQLQFRFWIGTLVVLILAMWVLREILLPFVVGTAIAYFLNPLVSA